MTELSEKKVTEMFGHRQGDLIQSRKVSEVVDQSTSSLEGAYWPHEAYPETQPLKVSERLELILPLQLCFSLPCCKNAVHLYRVSLYVERLDMLDTLVIWTL